MSPGTAGHNVYGSLQTLLASLKSKGENTGGGCIARVYPIESLADVNVRSEFELALARFAPLLEMTQPSAGGPQHPRRPIDCGEPSAAEWVRSRIRSKTVA